MHMHTREIQFEVDESPVPQPRQRFGVGVRGGRTIAVPVHDSRKSKRDGLSKQERIAGFKNAVKAAAVLSRSREWPVGEPGWGYRLLCVFKMPPPLDLPKTRSGYTVCPCKPDLDNIVKGVKDALTGILWKDDGAVFDERPLKVYPPAVGDPSCLIVVQAVKFSRRAGLSESDLGVLIAGWRFQSQLFEGA